MKKRRIAWIGALVLVVLLVATVAALRGQPTDSLEGFRHIAERFNMTGERFSFHADDLSAEESKKLRDEVFQEADALGLKKTLDFEKSRGPAGSEGTFESFDYMFESNGRDSDRIVLLSYDGVMRVATMEMVEDRHGVQGFFDDIGDWLRSLTAP